MPNRSRRHAEAAANPAPDPSPEHKPVSPGNFPVVGLGASAGGLEALGKFLDVLPPRTTMAFVLVQHLDPQHESMMADLLARHPPLPVRQVTDGMRLEPGHVFVIPPGSYLSVEADVLRLSRPRE